jgi:hypothetical protein
MKLLSPLLAEIGYDVVGGINVSWGPHLLAHTAVSNTNQYVVKELRSQTIQ